MSWSSKETPEPEAEDLEPVKTGFFADDEDLKNKKPRKVSRAVLAPPPE